ncbi:DUF6318 family protein [Arthrobacter sp. AB6]|uniref:DUF6318 family protein n=1 Tax=Arthrobacter sp. AB6 TaxID=2962570 RepID=UPI002880EED3|nr:DUF6318 family protein [Arthrobacter sp. AB6]MDT0195475.1 DUF6318 family protein [Arthrobacter sp. AB6]
MTSQNVPTPWQARSSAAAFIVAAGLILAGCAGGAPADPGTATATATTPASSSPSPTPTPSAVYKPADASGPAQNVPVPVLPEVAKTETKEGLEAFARYWYSTLSYAYETGEMGPLEAISGPTCASCAKVRTEVTDWHAEGRWLAGGKMVVEGVHSDFIETGPREYQAIVQVYQDTVDYHLPDGTIKGSVPRKPAVGDIVVAEFAGGGWKAKTVEHLVQ